MVAIRAEDLAAKARAEISNERWKTGSPNSNLAGSSQHGMLMVKAQNGNENEQTSISGAMATRLEWPFVVAVVSSPYE